jgi:hypothetical protein
MLAGGLTITMKDLACFSFIAAAIASLTPRTAKYAKRFAALTTHKM